MSNLLKSLRYELLLIFCGLLVLLVADFFLQMSCQTIVFPDSDNYLVAAKNLMVYHRGHDYRPIVMSFIYGFPFLFGASDTTVYVISFYINLIAWLSTAVLIFKICKTIVQPKTAFYFALIFCISSGIFSLLYHLLSENVYTFFMVLSFYFVIRYQKDKQFWYLAMALSILVCSMLIRPGSKWVALLFTLYFIRILWKNYAHKAMLLVYGSWLLVLVQCVGLYHQFGNFTISYIDSVTYYNYIGSKAMCYKEGKSFEQINNPRANVLLKLKSRDEIVKVAKADFIYQLKNNKINLFRAYLANIYDNTVSGSATIAVLENKKKTSFFKESKTIVFFLSIWQNRLFTLIGVFLAFYYGCKSYKTDFFITFISGFILYIVAVSGISSTQGDRFHLVFYPMVIVLTLKFFKEKKWVN
jgi:hypothetical protein